VQLVIIVRDAFLVWEQIEAQRPIVFATQAISMMELIQIVKVRIFYN
jgi:hypothetical protein